MSDAKPESKSFEDIVKRLEVIAKQLESGQTRLEDAVKLFEEGVQLAHNGRAQLDAAEKRLEVLLEGDKVSAFSPEAGVAAGAGARPAEAESPPPRQGGARPAETRAARPASREPEANEPPPPGDDDIPF